MQKRFQAWFSQNCKRSNGLTLLPYNLENLDKCQFCRKVRETVEIQVIREVRQLFLVSVCLDGLGTTI